MKLNLGENIRTYRRKLNLTQEQLADRLGVSGQSVSRWENGATYPDMEFLPVMARLFGCTTDDLLGCGKEYRTPTDRELQETIQKAVAQADVSTVISVLRTIRCECSDGAAMAVWHFIFSIRKGHPLYGNEELLKELRLYFRELLESGRFHISRSILIHTWLALETDEGAEEIIIRNAAGEDWDMSYIALRVARAEGLADFETAQKLRAALRFYKLNESLLDSALRKSYTPRDAVNSVVWKGINERKLRVIQEFCGMMPDPMYPVSGDGEPDIFVGTRLEIGFFYGAQLAAQGEADAALTVFEDCCTLIEKITEISDDLLEEFRQGRGDSRLCRRVTTRVPELAHLTAYIRPDRLFRASIPLTFPDDMELVVCCDDKILHRQIVPIDLEEFLDDPIHSCYRIDGAWLEKLRSLPRFQALEQRMETTLARYRRRFGDIT